MPQGALAGCRVIDLSRVLGGPYCTQMLADHGADVLKIEPPDGDETRGWGPPFAEGVAGGSASYFAGVNRNKRGITLNLARPEGREFLLTLLADADVVVENFKPGTMEKWGLGYERLKTDFPRLIHCRVSGFGGDGPWGGCRATTPAPRPCAA
ncbi:coA-transferase III family protein [Bordetella holmesii 35009]|nr:coA-transferase III family protein [Bordetella holmesii 35009]